MNHATEVDVLENMDPKVRAVLEALVVKQLAVKPEQLHAEAAFVRDLGADSLDMVDIVAALEEKLGLRIPDDEIGQMQTVGDAIRYLTARLAQDPLDRADRAVLEAR